MRSLLLLALLVLAALPAGRCLPAAFRPLGTVGWDGGRHYAYHEGVNLTGCDLFSRANVGSIDEVISILEDSYASAATYNRATREARFKVDPLDVRSLSTKMFGAVPQVVDEDCTTVVKDWDEIEAGVLVPTFIGHKAEYRHLLRSLEHAGGDKFHFVTVFTSCEEASEIMDRAAQDHVKRLRMRISFRTLVFDDPSLVRGGGGFQSGRKYNWGAVKKLWGLEHIDFKRGMVIFDSDFQFTKRKSSFFGDAGCSVKGMVAKYEKVLYRTPCCASKADRVVHQNVQRIVGSTWEDFPIDAPWVVTKEHIMELKRFLDAKYGGDYAKTFLGKMADEPVYEVALYRAFVRQTYPDYYTEVDTQEYAQKHGKTFLFDMFDLSSKEREALYPGKGEYDFAIASYYPITGPTSKWCVSMHHDRVSLHAAKREQGTPAPAPQPLSGPRHLEGGEEVMRLEAYHHEHPVSCPLCPKGEKG